mgnify:CR=1 FL=1
MWLSTVFTLTTSCSTPDMTGVDVDARGRLEIIGRRADTIVTGGENVVPSEVEDVLVTHPCVVDAGVYGRADPEWGEAVLATVVLRDGVTVDPEELRAFCAARLARFKVPKAIGFAPSLPRTACGCSAIRATSARCASKRSCAP